MGKIAPLFSVTMITVLISCIAAPGSSSAASFSQADVKKVSDAMKKMNAALSTSMAQKKQSPRIAFSRLVSDGFLDEYPPVPDGIGDGSGNFGKGDYNSWGDRNARVGGCGPESIGEKRTFNILLRNVSDEFCKAYNKLQGLDAAILDNCEQGRGNACKTSGSEDGDDPVDAGKPTFCFKTADSINTIFYNTGIDANIPCEK